MNTTRIFCVLCVLLMMICLALSVTSMLVLHNTNQKENEWNERAALLEEVLTNTQDREEETDTEETTEPPSSPSLETDILYQRLCIRAVNGKIAVYSEDGYLIRTVNVDVKTLPTKEQKALEKGIYVDSWRELIDLIRDYE